MKKTINLIVAALWAVSQWNKNGDMNPDKFRQAMIDLENAILDLGIDVKKLKEVMS